METLSLLFGGPAYTTVLVVIFIYFSVLGCIDMFHRHHAFLIILYLVILFPLACIHMFLRGVFRVSKKWRKNKNRARKDARMEEEARREGRRLAIIDRERKQMSENERAR